ncbi:MAG: transposase [Nitrosomonas sp.]|nr:transposase [Nitrosomonas sp.]
MLQDIQNAITQAGHTLEYLPAYSPDLNPIEHNVSTSQSYQKTTKVHTVEQLFKIESFYDVGYNINADVCFMDGQRRTCCLNCRHIPLLCLARRSEA